MTSRQEWGGAKNPSAPALRPRVRTVPPLALIAVSLLTAVVIARFAGQDPPPINLDYFALCILASLLARKADRLAGALLFGGFLFIFAVQFTQSALLPYMSGLAEGAGHIRYIDAWPWRSVLPQFLLLFAALAVIGAVALRTDPRGSVWPLLALGALAFAADSFGTSSPAPARLRVFDANMATSSAVTLSGAMNQALGDRPEPTLIPGRTMRNDLAGTNAPRILSIAVESWGIYKDRDAQKSLDRIVLAGLERDYTAETFEQERYGATLAAELRELCAIRLAGTPPVSSIAPVAHRCLPHELGARGWATLGLHGHHGGFYNRAAIYQAIGFDAGRFRRDMTQPEPPPCMRSMFGGICDVIVLRDALKFLAWHDRAFAHVITLDTHFPLQQNGLADPSCAVGNVELCLYDERMSAALRGLTSAIKAAPVLPDLVYIYGDHRPPFSNGEALAHFEPDLVPFIVLRKRVPRK